ncbi:MAG: sigma 54-interacting transcriptional regulator [Deltaproteobacteria bacterium]|jgi:transcriptional regulator with PAS, ATPase and Fis domain|nr:sigma 54-interacting transcriptional regulator [Deltaproteobacteria bacterium]
MPKKPTKIPQRCLLGQAGPDPVATGIAGDGSATARREVAEKATEGKILAGSASAKAVKVEPTLSEVAFIAPYKALAELAAKVSDDLGWPILVKEGDLAAGFAEASALMGQGVKMFISRGGTARLIKTLGLPVVEIGVSACDILESLNILRESKPGFMGPMGLIGFENILTGAHRLGDILKMDLRLAAINHESEVPDRLRSLMDEGIQVVLGDRIVTGEAEALGLTAALVQSGIDAVADALREARERLSMLNRAEEEHRSHLAVLSQFKTVLDVLEDPVLILDRAGAVHNRNQAAMASRPNGGDSPLDRFDWKGLPAFRQAFTSGRAQADQLTDIGGQRYLLDFRPIPGAPESGDNEPGEPNAPLLAVIARSAEKVETSERHLRQKVYLKGHVARYRFEDIVTEDAAFRRLLELSSEYALSDSAILIQGESGTGKEMLAQSVHNHKFGGRVPFVALNCASLPASILESELFGYAPGAFTGALKEGKKGIFELAHGGSLFLDELGEMPLDLQSRLLRAIEEKAILPVGGDRLIPVRARILAATNVNLAEAVRQGKFRKDLYFRLGVLTVSIPPLRERGRDPLLLFQKLAHEINPGLDPLFWEDPKLSGPILDHPWPGNAREIKNLVERLSIITGGFTKRLELVESLLAEGLATSRLVALAEPSPCLAPENRRDVIPEALRSRRKAELAKELGISRSTLWRRLKRLG